MHHKVQVLCFNFDILFSVGDWHMNWMQDNISTYYFSKGINMFLPNMEELVANVKGVKIAL